MDCLAGIRLEATDSPETALQYYNELLEGDPTNLVRPLHLSYLFYISLYI